MILKNYKKKDNEGRKNDFPIIKKIKGINVTPRDDLENLN